MSDLNESFFCRFLPTFAFSEVILASWISVRPLTLHVTILIKRRREMNVFHQAANLSDSFSSSSFSATQ